MQLTPKNILVVAVPLLDPNYEPVSDNYVTIFGPSVTNPANPSFAPFRHITRLFFQFSLLFPSIQSQFLPPTLESASVSFDSLSPLSIDLSFIPFRSVYRILGLGFLISLDLCQISSICHPLCRSINFIRDFFDFLCLLIPIL